jgi:hypothetical protein
MNDTLILRHKSNTTQYINRCIGLSYQTEITSGDPARHITVATGSHRRNQEDGKWYYYNDDGFPVVSILYKHGDPVYIEVVCRVQHTINYIEVPRLIDSKTHRYQVYRRREFEDQGLEQWPSQVFTLERKSPRMSDKK